MTNILENFQALLVDFSRLLHNTKTPLRRYELLARLIWLTLSRYQYVRGILPPLRAAVSANAGSSLFLWQ